MSASSHLWTTRWKKISSLYAHFTEKTDEWNLHCFSDLKNWPENLTFLFLVKDMFISFCWFRLFQLLHLEAICCKPIQNKCIRLGSNHYRKVSAKLYRVTAARLVGQTRPRKITRRGCQLILNGPNRGANFWIIFFILNLKPTHFINTFLFRRVWEILQKIPGNEVCCDCGDSNPCWASINLGITLCIGTWGPLDNIIFYKECTYNFWI